MRRIAGDNTVDIGGGKQGFRDRNAQIGQVGTTVTAAWLNEIQEEIAAFVEAMNLELQPGNPTQLGSAVNEAARVLMRLFGLGIGTGFSAPQVPNIDTALTSGFFYASGDADNLPFGWNAAHLLVLMSIDDDWGAQILVHQDGDAIAIRRRSDGAWAQWKLVDRRATNAEIDSWADIPASPSPEQLRRALRNAGLMLGAGANAPTVSDLNAAPVSRFAYASGTASNRPFAWGAVHLITQLSLGDAWGFQLGVNQDADEAAFRRRGNGNWGYWRRLVTPEWLTALGLDIGMLAITSTQTFNPATHGIPVGAKIIAALWGAGGGASSQQSSAGGAGGAGGFAVKVIDAATVTVTIGAGGAGNTAGSPGTAGGTSSWGALFSATGGSGGSGGAGVGGTGVSGDINLVGGSGDDMLGSGLTFARGGTAPLLGMTRGLNAGASASYAGGGSAALEGPFNVADPGGPGLAFVFWRK